MDYMAGIDLGPDGYTTVVVMRRHADGTIEVVRAERRPMTINEQQQRVGEYVAKWRDNVD